MANALVSVAATVHNVQFVLALGLLSGCAFVEVREGDRVTRGFQWGAIAPAAAEIANPVSVNRWVAGFWASQGQLSVGLVREAAWVVPRGEACVLRGQVGEAPAVMPE